MLTPAQHHVSCAKDPSNECSTHAENAACLGDKRPIRPIFSAMTQHKPKLGEASSVRRQQNQFDRSLADSTIANYREGAPPRSRLADETDRRVQFGFCPVFVR